MFKQCTTCKEWKSISDFYKSKGGKFGVVARCAVCTNIYMRNRHQREDVKLKRSLYAKERHLNEPNYRLEMIKRSAQYYGSVIGRARTLLNNARKSPISQIIPCTVTLEHVVALIEKKICPATGFTFQMFDTREAEQRRTHNPYSPSIDRINSKLGYTNENTRIVIWQYNMGKGETSDEQMLLFCQAVVWKSKQNDN